MKKQSDSVEPQQAYYRNKVKARRLKVLGTLSMTVGIFGVFAAPLFSLAIFGGLVLFVWGRFLE